jgi:hypothetical protein
MEDSPPEARQPESHSAGLPEAPPERLAEVPPERLAEVPPEPLSGMPPARPAGGPGARQSEVPSRYRVHRLPDAKPTERGVLYRRGRDRYLLAWKRVLRAFAAEVGGGDGAGRIVFDLAIQTEGSECVACRLDATPGEEAMRVARAIQLGIGVPSCSPCVRSLANDGAPSQAYADLDVFAEAALEAVRFG